VVVVHELWRLGWCFGWLLVACLMWAMVVVVVLVFGARPSASAPSDPDDSGKPYGTWHCDVVRRRVRLRLHLPRGLVSREWNIVVISSVVAGRAVRWSLR
jgi:hypothetical protein